MREEEAIVAIFAMIVFAGVGLMIAAIMSRRGVRQMEHRERLAMIERGLMPSPESDPMGFESAAGLPRSQPEPGVGYRTVGVLMIGFGLGLLMLIAFTAGEPRIALGVGGAWTILGAASLLNYFLISKRAQERGTPRRWTPTAAPRPPEPPANIAP